jgi:hypothetical protein
MPISSVEPGAMPQVILALCFCRGAPLRETRVKHKFFEIDWQITNSYRLDKHCRHLVSEQGIENRRQAADKRFACKRF